MYIESTTPSMLTDLPFYLIAKHSVLVQRYNPPLGPLTLHPVTHKGAREEGIKGGVWLRKKGEKKEK
jgi:hypothetical protein